MPVSGPLVSICIPTVDRLHYLEQTVDSARAQTLREVEILIADDGSSAPLRAWAEARAREDRRITYTKNPRRLGLAGNWNACVERARGTYVTLIGDDDRLLPAFAERLLAAGQGSDVVFCDQYLIDATGDRLPEETEALRRRYRRHELPPGAVRDPERWVWRNSVPMSAALIRRDVARRLAFKDDLETPEIELFARLASEGGTFYFVPELLAEYRSHPGSLTAAGLSLERLVRYLEPIPVSRDVEADKRALLASFGVAGVHRLLLAGDVRAARALCRSRYYPRRFAPDRALVQRCFALLPQPAARLYAPLFRTAKRVRTLMRGEPRK